MRLCRLLFSSPLLTSQRIPYGLFYQVFVAALRSVHLQYPNVPFPPLIGFCSVAPEFESYRWSSKSMNLSTRLDPFKYNVIVLESAPGVH